MSLSPRDEQIARLKGRGLRTCEVAARLGVSESTVKRVLRDSTEAQALARRTREAADPAAVDVLRELLSSQSEQVRLRAAIALLAAPVADPAAPDEGDASRVTVVERI